MEYQICVLVLKMLEKLLEQARQRNRNDEYVERLQAAHKAIAVIKPYF